MENNNEKTELGKCIACCRLRPLTSFRMKCGAISSACSECRTGVNL